MALLNPHPKVTPISPPPKGGSGEFGERDRPKNPKMGRLGRLGRKKKPLFSGTKRGRA